MSLFSDGVGDASRVIELRVMAMLGVGCSRQVSREVDELSDATASGVGI
jgi:hypothetical protein